MQRSASVQLVEHLQKRDDFPASTVRRPTPLGRSQMIADGCMLRIFKHQAIEHSVTPGRWKERKGIVHSNRTIATIKQLAKISFAMPAFGVGGRLEAVILNSPVPGIESLDSISATVSTLAEGVCDKIPSARDGALDHGADFQFPGALHGWRGANA